MWATGHYRNGILLAPLTAELVAGVLTRSTPEGEEHRALLCACDPLRFGSPDSSHPARSPAGAPVGVLE